MEISESIDIIEDCLTEYFESRTYQFYCFQTVINSLGEGEMLSYNDYKKKLTETKIEKVVDVEELKRENEDILKSFFEKR